MNLQLTKINKQNAFDYKLLSEFMVRKRGKLIFNVGFGYTGDAGQIKKKEDENYFQKFEREFQLKSIIKTYKEIFHLGKKLKNNYFENLKLPYMNVARETHNIKFPKDNNYNLKNIKSRNILNGETRRNRILDLKSGNFVIKNNNQNIEIDKNNEIMINYKNYFYNTLDSFKQGTTSPNFDNELTTNKSTSLNNIQSNKKPRKLLKNISEDHIYLFGKNKIILNNKKKKNKQLGLLTQFYNNLKTPFKDYEDFNRNKTKIRLRKDFNFFKTNKVRNFTEIKQEYLEKIRYMYGKEKTIEYKFCFLPSHYSVKKIIRKAEKDEEKN